VTSVLPEFKKIQTAAAFKWLLVLSVVVHGFITLLPLDFLASTPVKEKFIELKVTFGSAISEKEPLEAEQGETVAILEDPKIPDEIKALAKALVSPLKKDGKQLNVQTPFASIHTSRIREDATAKNVDLKQQQTLSHIMEDPMVFEQEIEYQPTANEIRIPEKKSSPIEEKAGEVRGNAEMQTENTHLNYEQMLPLWLNQFRHYPEKARKMGITGEGVVFIKINRQGEILFSQVRETTGYEILDDALMAMLKDANPVLPLPEEYYPDKKTRSYEVKFRFGGKAL
jgi:TonB family protein